MTLVPFLLVGQLLASAPARSVRTSAPDDAALLKEVRTPVELRQSSRHDFWTLLGFDEGPHAEAEKAASSGLEAVLHRLEKDFKVSPEAARALVEVWYWERRARTEGSQALAREKIEDALQRAARACPGNRLIAGELALNARGGGHDENAARLFDYLDHAPDPGALARAFIRPGGYVGAMASAVSGYALARDPASRAKFVAYLGNRDYGIGRLALALVALRPPLAEDDPTRVPLTAQAIESALQLGLPFLAANVFTDSPAKVRTRLITDVPRDDPAGDSSPDFRPELAVALLLSGGSRVEAQALAKGSSASACSRTRRSAFAFSPALTTAVLAFQLDGERPKDPFDVAVHLPSCASYQCTAWWFGAAELLVADYPQVVRDVTWPQDLQTRRMKDYEDELLVAPQLVPVFQPVIDRIEASLQAEAKFVDGVLAKAPPIREADKDPMAPVIQRLITATSPSVFTELPLPKKLPTSRAKPVLASLSKGFERVRAEKVGKHVVAIALSSRLDPSGEISSGAYWLLESNDAGVHWSRPTYLGLRQNQPYVVPGRSKLPLLDGDTLNLEVEVRELDPSTITFPPIGLGLKRVQKGLFLRAKLSELRRDSDGDGLADRVEERLLLDPHLADTDHDGISDGSDPVPQVASKGTSGAPPELMAQFIEVVTGRGARPQAQVIGVDEPHVPRDDLAHAVGKPEPLVDAPLLYVEGDRRDFRGFSSPQRLIVLSPDEVEKLGTKFGVFYPMRIKVIVNRAGDRAYIEFDERWRGGSYSATRTHGEWTLTPMRSWVT